MKDWLFSILPLLPIIVISGCDDPDAFDCIKKAGDFVEQEVSIEEFDRLFIEDDIELYVTYGQIQKVTVAGGKNLLAAVDFSLDGKDLTISNHNKCNWTRDYQPVIVNIITNQLREIESRGYGIIKSTNTLLFDTLIVESKDGSGDIDLALDVCTLGVINNSLANLTISGQACRLDVSHWYNDGRFDGSRLQVNQIKVTHNGVNTIKLLATEKLIGTINSRGNVICYGSPAIIDVKVTGEGQLIHQ